MDRDDSIKIRMIMFLCKFLNKPHPDFPVGSKFYDNSDGIATVCVYLGHNKCGPNIVCKILNMKKGKWLIAILMLIASSAKAGSFGRYGVGVFNSAVHSHAETKIFSLGYEEDFFGPFIKQYEIGVWADNAGDGRKSSGFGNISMGIEVNPGALVLRTLWGVGAITTPDSMLGGWFQFNQDLLLGLRDRRGNMIGLNYKHISSAGIYDPNKGRDFLTIQAEIPW